MANDLRFSNINGGKPPYTNKIIPLNDAAGTINVDIPNGIWRGIVQDADDNVSAMQQLTINDASHVTDRKVNWDKIPNFTLPSGMMAVYGWGAPRWLDEASPTDALNRGWTHTDNCSVDSTELVNAKRAKFLIPTQGAYMAAIGDVLGSNPNAINVRIMVRWKLINGGNSAGNFTYVDYQGNTQNGTIAAAEGAATELIIDSLLYNDPTWSEKYEQSYFYHNPSAASDADIIAVGKAYYAREKWSKDGVANNATAFRATLFLFDEEVVFSGGADRTNALIMKGMSQQAAADNNPIGIIYYGKSFADFGGGFYSGQQELNVGWKQKIFPFLTPALRASAKQFNAWFNHQSIVDANCVYVDSQYFYFKALLPQTQTKYEKQNGNYRLDQDGERVYRFNQFTENIRGETVTFHNTSIFGVNVHADSSYGYPNNIVPEVFWAVEQMYSMLSRFIWVRFCIAKKLRDSDDIYTHFANEAIKSCPVFRDRTEGTFPGYGVNGRPIPPYMLEFQVMFNFMLCNNMYIWTDYGNITHPNEGAGVAAVNKATGFRCPENPSGILPQDLGAFEDLTWSLKLVKWLNDNYGLFSTGSKSFVAYEPANVNHEIAIAGRVKDNYVVVVYSEPRLDFDEAMTVKFTNKKNSFTRTASFKGCQNYINVYELPEGVTYEPADLIFEYKDIYNVTHKVSGDLRSHIVS